MTTTNENRERLAKVLAKAIADAGITNCRADEALPVVDAILAALSDTPAYAPGKAGDREGLDLLAQIEGFKPSIIHCDVEGIGEVVGWQIRNASGFRGLSFMLAVEQALAPSPTGNEAPRGEVPAGWKLVPEKADADMVLAPLPPGSSITGARFESRRDLRPLIWQAMLAAAPPPPVSTDQIARINGGKGVEIELGTSEYDSEAFLYDEPYPGMIVVFGPDGLILRVEIEDLSANMAPPVSAEPDSRAGAERDDTRSLAEQARHHGRDWAVWWQGSGERGDHIMEMAQHGLSYGRELVVLGPDHHDEAGKLVAEHNEQVRRLREVIGRQAAAKTLLQAQVAALHPSPPTASGAAAPVGEALADIAAERRRQVEVEGWTPEHDDAHDEGELADAAACYAAGTALMAPVGTGSDNFVSLWPWLSSWWKPTNRRRDLVKAGALIVAEIERLDRAQANAREPDWGLVYGGGTEA